MKNSLNNHSRRGNVPARTVWFGAPAPDGNRCIVTVEINKGSATMEKAKPSMKLAVAFVGESRVVRQIPVLARRTKHYEPGEKRESTHVPAWFFTRTQDGRNNQFSRQRAVTWARALAETAGAGSKSL